MKQKLFFTSLRDFQFVFSYLVQEAGTSIKWLKGLHGDWA